MYLIGSALPRILGISCSISMLTTSAPSMLLRYDRTRFPLTVTSCSVPCIPLFVVSACAVGVLWAAVVAAVAHSVASNKCLTDGFKVA